MGGVRFTQVENVSGMLLTVGTRFGYTLGRLFFLCCVCVYGDKGTCEEMQRVRLRRC